MNEQEAYLDMVDKQLQQERLRNLDLQNQLSQVNMSGFVPEKEQNLVEYQLDLKEELDRIYHLLSGHLLTRKDGNETWEEPTDDRLKIFSEYGVKQIMNIISFYVNRNTLLSYYDEVTIKWKVRDFGIELADLIFNRYESFFHYPKPEELYEKYLPYINEFNIKESELYEKCVQWSKEELQDKIRHYPMLCLAIIDVVHSTYLRAVGGKERGSLRERVHISQTANQNQAQPARPRFSLIKPATWGG